MIYILGPRDRKPFPHLTVVNTTSRGGEWAGLSPFLIGPCKLYLNFTSLTMENAWQYAKLYLGLADLSNSTKPTPAKGYWDWAKNGWANPRAVRYPMGKGAIPLGSWWNGKLLDYIEARKRIYIPLYAKAVRRTGAFGKLQRLYKEEGTLGLWDFDGYNHHSLNYTHQDVIHDETRKMGHAFVLAMMLEGKL